MIKTTNKQTTINATSVVLVNTPTGEVEVPVNYMNATIQTNGKFAINQAIQNEEIYFQHLEEVSEDYTTFYNYVVELAKKEME